MGGNPESEITSRELIAYNKWFREQFMHDVDLASFPAQAWLAGIEWQRQVFKHDLRIIQLGKMTKVQLAVIAGNHDTANDMFLLNEYSRWSKDELITRILDQEYPEVRPRPGL